MPVLQPAELWRRTGRYEIDELFKLRDRKDADFVLAMTHEENITYHVARDVRSYRELPMILYHLQTKERDEPRPRAGVLRTREFTMKDSYSFDRDAEGLDRSYELHIAGLRPHLRPLRARVAPGRVRRRDDGRAPAPTTTWRRARRARTRSRSPPVMPPTWRSPSRSPQPVELPPALDEPREGADSGPDHRRGGRRRRSASRRRADQGDAGDRERAHGVGAGPRRPPPERAQASKGARGADFRAARPRGDRRRARPARVHRAGRRRAARAQGRGDPGRGIRGRRERAGRAPDRRLARPGLQLRGGRRPLGRGGGHRARRRPDRDRARDRGRRASSSSAPATRSRSAPPTSTSTGRSARSSWAATGSARRAIVAAAIEQRADEKGIVWPRSIAPWDVHLVGLGKPGDETTQAADALYGELRDAGARGRATTTATPARARS